MEPRKRMLPFGGLLRLGSCISLLHLPTIQNSQGMRMLQYDSAITENLGEPVVHGIEAGLVRQHIEDGRASLRRVGKCPQECRFSLSASGRRAKDCVPACRRRLRLMRK